MIQAQSKEPILTRVGMSEPGAIEECIARFEGLIWSLARRFCRPDDSEDAVQEIFVEIWRSAGRYDPARGSEATFVGVIARRNLIDRVRSRQRRRRDQQVAECQEIASPSPSLPAEHREEAGLAILALSRLAKDERIALGLAVERGLTQSAIAKVMDIPLGTVKTHVRRGLIKLRQIGKADDGRYGRVKGSGVLTVFQKGAA